MNRTRYVKKGIQCWCEPILDRLSLLIRLSNVSVIVKMWRLFEGQYLSNLLNFRGPGKMVMIEKNG